MEPQKEKVKAYLQTIGTYKKYLNVEDTFLVGLIMAEAMKNPNAKTEQELKSILKKFKSTMEMLMSI